MTAFITYRRAKSYKWLRKILPNFEAKINFLRHQIYIVIYQKNAPKYYQLKQKV